MLPQYPESRRKTAINERCDILDEAARAGEHIVEQAVFVRLQICLLELLFHFGLFELLVKRGWPQVPVVLRVFNIGRLAQIWLEFDG